MKMSKEGLCELANFEALILTPYYCSSEVKTIGLGSTQSDIADLSLWPWGKTITIEEAVQYYKKGLWKYENAVNKAIGGRIIPQHQFDALVSITYNIGVGGMRGSTFMKLFNAGADMVRVGNAMKAWNRGGGKVVRGLIIRRQKEVNLLQKGIYLSGGKVDLVPVNARTHLPEYSKAKKINFLSYL